MSGLAVRNKNGEKVHYTGTQFDGLENEGTHHLCVRTGQGAGGVKKYGLTSSPLNDKYKALKMRIPDNAGGNAGKEAYIAQRYSVGASTSAARTYTTSRVSNYVSSTTLRTASSSKSTTKTATRISTHSPIYYGSSPVTFTSTTYTNTAGLNGGKVSLTGKLMNGSSETSYHTSDYWQAQWSFYASSNGKYIVKGTFSDTYTVTRTVSSRVSNYVSSQILSTASSSKLSTGNATRSSAYNTSSSVSTTTLKETHNVNL